MSERRRLAPEEEIASALASISHLEGDLPARLLALSASLLGRPYFSFPLVGSKDQPEQLVTSLDGFDCVTFAESALALAWSKSPSDFPERLVAVRYQRGRVDWAWRNHYMHDWIRCNMRAGLVSPVSPGRWVPGGKPRQMTVLKDYPPAPRERLVWAPRYFPSRDAGRLSAEGRGGDVLCFVSNRKDLDTFHVGLLVPDDPPAVRHASRSAGAVIHQDLAEFLAKNDVPGMLVVRANPLPDAA